MIKDVLLTVDAGSSVVLVLLNLSAAFDTVDHTVLFSRLEQFVGIQGKALNWFQSFFKEYSNLSLPKTKQKLLSFSTSVPH